MLRFATVLAAVLLTGFQAASPTLPPRLAALAEDAAAARAFDYMALKAEGADLKALSDAVYRRTRVDGDQPRALTEAETILQMELAAAAEAPDAKTFAADRIAAAAAWDRWIAFGEAVMAGQPVAEPPFSYVADRVRMAKEATDPRIHELLRRAARDQLLRRGWDVGDDVWLDAPTPGARSRFNSLLGRQAWEVDHGNTEWLKADIAANGWYLISVHGEAASSAAWLMTQHADRDRPFQRHVLALLEPLVTTGETRRSNYAYLYDRIAVGENRPQRYGSQGRCVAPRVWAPNDLEDPDGVQALRDENDLGSLAEYTARMHQYCADFTG
ncbi:MAG: hypothetical protein Q7U72_05960 [Brevundimonas sp.]|uniref:DUF6624 domain-containing protein n=1 Tax=Brevundimonas sp. TaxID=1871086 RepID=UPI0027288155|nr:DUF6624 domain-containing protein [Brevundimonas sp.]MDO9076983.1 hypothetical protein [Brevundimonas sp.]MDP3081174.1 hypothetical protein [Brevundimonas sp.]MDZ4060166.1 DUF6624 domain-containing protein [Brevundimonas sp.]